MNRLLDYYNNIDNLSHAFLIGNVVFDEIENDLTEVINKRILITEKLNLRENPDIYYFDQNDNLITKDSIKNLINNLYKTSQISNTKIYIINGAEKLSDTVYNSLLKTLEEPASNIYAFLITKNIESVKDTIRSRCQKIYINSENDIDKFDEETKNLASEFINLLETKKNKIIYEKPRIYNLIDDRIKFQNILKLMLKEYNLSLKKMLNVNKYLEENNEIIKNNDIITLSKKILIIDKFINLLNNYLNKNLTIDRFIIEMWRCNNDMCRSRI